MRVYIIFPNKIANAKRSEMSREAFFELSFARACDGQHIHNFPFHFYAGALS